MSKVVYEYRPETGKLPGMTFEEQTEDFLNNLSDRIENVGDAAEIADEALDKASDAVDRVTNIESTVNNHTQTLTNHEQRITVLEENDVVQDGRLDALETAVDGHTVDISSVQSAVAANTGNISTNAADITSVKADITSLEEAVAENTADITALESELEGKLNTDFSNVAAGSEGKLVPTGGTVGQVLGRTAAGTGWVDQTGSGGGGIPDAPFDGKLYGRQDGEWTEIEDGGGGVYDVRLMSDPEVLTVGTYVQLDVATKYKLVTSEYSALPLEMYHITFCKDIDGVEETVGMTFVPAEDSGTISFTYTLYTGGYGDLQNGDTLRVYGYAQDVLGNITRKWMPAEFVIGDTPAETPARFIAVLGIPNSSWSWPPSNYDWRFGRAPANTWSADNPDSAAATPSGAKSWVAGADAEDVGNDFFAVMNSEGNLPLNTGHIFYDRVMEFDEIDPTTALPTGNKIQYGTGKWFCIALITGSGSLNTLHPSQSRYNVYTADDITSPKAGWELQGMLQDRATPGKIRTGYRTGWKIGRAGNLLFAFNNWGDINISLDDGASWGQPTMPEYVLDPESGENVPTGNRIPVDFGFPTDVLSPDTDSEDASHGERSAGNGWAVVTSPKGIAIFTSNYGERPPGHIYDDESNTELRGSPFLTTLSTEQAFTLDPRCPVDNAATSWPGSPQQGLLSFDTTQTTIPGVGAMGGAFQVSNIWTGYPAVRSYTVTNPYGKYDTSLGIGFVQDGGLNQHVIVWGATPSERSNGTAIIHSTNGGWSWSALYNTATGVDTDGVLYSDKDTDVDVPEGQRIYQKLAAGSEGKGTMSLPLATVGYKWRPCPEIIDNVGAVWAHATEYTYATAGAYAERDVPVVFWRCPSMEDAGDWSKWKAATLTLRIRGSQTRLRIDMVDYDYGTGELVVTWIAPGGLPLSFPDLPPTEDVYLQFRIASSSFVDGEFVGGTPPVESMLLVDEAKLQGRRAYYPGSATTTE